MKEKSVSDMSDRIWGALVLDMSDMSDSLLVTAMFIPTRPCRPEY